MEDQPSFDEPVVDRWTEEAKLRRRKRPGLHPGFFSLSGGVMRDKSGSGNRIDYLLAKLLENPEALYIPDIDRNLDCLFTSLQLEMVDPHRSEKDEQVDEESTQPRQKTTELKA